MFSVYLRFNDDEKSHYQGVSQTLLGAKQMAGVVCNREFGWAVVVDDQTGDKYIRTESGKWGKLRKQH